MNPDFYLLFDRITVQAANAVSGPFSYGFPAIGGFVGAVHALQRRLPENLPLRLGGVLIACHQCRPHTFRADRYTVFKQTRNPVQSDGKLAPITEEGKADLTVSLVIEVFTDTLPDAKQKAEWTACLQTQLLGQRLAGGSILQIGSTRLIPDYDLPRLAYLLCPAYILTDASDLLPEITAEVQAGKPSFGIPPRPQATALDALLAACAIYRCPPPPDHPNDTEWHTYSFKHGHGWLVPLMTGYQAISPLFAAGQLQHCRNPEYPAQYVEPLYTLGKWQFALWFSGSDNSDRLRHHFWRFRQPENQLYLYTTAGENCLEEL